MRRPIESIEEARDWERPLSSRGGTKCARRSVRRSRRS